MAVDVLHTIEARDDVVKALQRSLLQFLERGREHKRALAHLERDLEERTRARDLLCPRIITAACLFLGCAIVRAPEIEVRVRRPQHDRVHLVCHHQADAFDEADEEGAVELGAPVAAGVVDASGLGVLLAADVIDGRGYPEHPVVAKLLGNVSGVATLPRAEFGDGGGQRHITQLGVDEEVMANVQALVVRLHVRQERVLRVAQDSLCNFEREGELVLIEGSHRRRSALLGRRARRRRVDVRCQQPRALHRVPKHVFHDPALHSEVVVVAHLLHVSCDQRGPLVRGLPARQVLHALREIVVEHVRIRLRLRGDEALEARGRLRARAKASRGGEPRAECRLRLTVEQEVQALHALAEATACPLDVVQLRLRVEAHDFARRPGEVAFVRVEARACGHAGSHAGLHLLCYEPCGRHELVPRVVEELEREQ